MSTSHMQHRAIGLNHIKNIVRINQHMPPSLPAGKCAPCFAVCVEAPKLAAAQAAAKLHINGPVLLANALAAFALNLVGEFGCRGLRVVADVARTHTNKPQLRGRVSAVAAGCIMCCLPSRLSLPCSYCLHAGTSRFRLVHLHIGVALASHCYRTCRRMVGHVGHMQPQYNCPSAILRACAPCITRLVL